MGDLDDPVEGGTAPSAPANADNGSSVLSRYSEFGLDLGALDPEEVARGLDLSRRFSGRDPLTEDEVEQRVKRRLEQTLTHPQARALFAKHYGLYEAPPDPNAEPMDPRDAQISRLEQGMSGLVNMVQQLQNSFGTTQKRAEAKEAVTSLSKELQAAIAATPGAEDDEDLERLFWTEVSYGKIGKSSLPNQFEIRKWVKTRTDRFNAKIENAAKRRRAGKFAGSGSSSTQKPEPTTEEEVMDQIRAELGLVRD